MIVAVTFVDMVKVPVDPVVAVVAVGDHRVTAADAVPVRGVVAAAGVKPTRASDGIFLVDLDDVLVGVRLVDEVKVPVVEVVDVIAVANRDVAAKRTVRVEVRMNRVGHAPSYVRARKTIPRIVSMRM